MVERQRPYRQIGPHPFDAATRADAIQAGPGAVPDFAVAAGHQRLPRRVAQDFGIQGDHPVARARFRVQPLQSRQRADPDLAGVRQQCRDFPLRLLATEDLVSADRARGQVESRHILGIGTHPERPVAFGCQCRHVTVGKARRIARIMSVLHVPLAVVTVQAALRGHPDESQRILCERIHRVLPETSLAAQALEVIIARKRSGIRSNACAEQARDHCDQAGG